MDKQPTFTVVNVNMLHVQDMYKLIQDKLVGVQASHCSQALSY